MHERLGAAAKAAYVIEDGIIRITLHGAVSSAHVIEVREAFLGDHAYVQGMPCLYDLRPASLAHMDSNELHQILTHGQAVAGRRGHHRTALLAPADVMFGVSRMYEAIGERPDLTIGVFREEEAALAWLRADPSDAE